ncbi:MAG TPA: xanthine dehydrogenase family protein molybdopterin-binding subunit [Acidimicrobiales bacterium]|nr:xanthine dehydrogenase family protein molybdopterin-binding subunit [Acidimicrobiales bacterium]
MLGRRLVRTEDQALLTRGGTFVADLRTPALDGAGHVAFARSHVAHAEILGLDLDRARAAPGVVAVLGGADVDFPDLAPSDPRVNQAMVRPFLATATLRFVGEPLAVVVAETRAEAIDAAGLVAVETRLLPAVVDLDRALGGEVLVHPAAGTNTAATFRAGSDDADDDLFAGCDVVVRQTVVNQRLAACPLETRAGAAAWVAGRLHVWSSTQTPQAARDAIAAALGLDPGAVHLVAPDVGGGFGPKIGLHREDVVVAWLARRLGRPVRWSEARTENLLAMGHGRGQRQEVAIGGRRDGRVLAYRLDVVQDAGAYPRDGAILPELTAAMAPGVYGIDRVAVRARSVVTTTMSTTSYRGAGRPEATAAVERAMDRFAAEVGLDPAEARRRNLVTAADFPHTTAVGTTYDTGDYAGALDRVLAAAGYDELRAEQARRRRAGEELALGIGLSCYVEVTAGLAAGSEVARVVLGDDGTVVVYTGTSPHGQGHDTAWAMIAADCLDLPVAAVTVVHGDTDAVPVGGGTSGSRSLQLGGAAVLAACEDLLRRAGELEADGGSSPASGGTRRWSAIAAAATASGAAPLAGDAVFAAGSPTYPFGAHLAVVEVDTGTGGVALVGLTSVDDAGTVLNPLLAEGQRHGGIAQGVAQALVEEVVYDHEGQPRTTTLDDYGIVTAGDLPSFRLLDMATPTPVNRLGAKGVGEAGTIGSTVAVQNAVIDAVSHRRVRHIDLPCTPERVWRALEAAGRQR